MNFGPLEFGAYLRRQESFADDSAEVRAARDAAPPTDPASQRLAVRLKHAVAKEPVSVYEAIIDRAPGRGDPVRVRVQPAWRPVVLVLSSHQPTCWQIEASPGVDLRAILLAGSGGSRVSGATGIPVSCIGGFYAFKPGSLEYHHLEREVQRCAGCVIEHFHRTYAEGHFVLGVE